MTVFAVPFPTLPNGGAIEHPDTSGPEHHAAISGIALIDDLEKRHAEGKAYADRTHAAKNSQLRAAAAQVSGTLETAEEASRDELNRHRSGIASGDDVKAVVSSDAVVARDWPAILMALFATFLVVPVYIATEAKLLAQTVITTGVLGLDPDSRWDVIFAFAFAGAPLAWAFLKCSLHGALKTDRERAAHLNALRKAAKWIAIPAWIVAFTFLFGPSLIRAAADMVDPFVGRPEWSETITVFISETQVILQEVSRLIGLLLVFAVLYGASTIVAAIWISQREAFARSRREDVRAAEEYAFRVKAGATLLADQLQSDISIGRVRGLIEEIDAARAAFVAEVQHEVEAVRQRGEQARRAAILDRPGANRQVIDAGPLFARR